jgi:hypothetical protein
MQCVLLNLFESLSPPPLLFLQDNWSEVMFAASDTTGVDNQPYYAAWVGGAAYFIIFMAVCR